MDCEILFLKIRIGKTMKTLAFILITPTLLFLSCETKSSASDATKASKAVSSAAEKARPIDAADFKGKLDELLTLEMAARVSGFDASKATKVHENKTAAMFGDKDASPRECNYLWKNGRIRTITVGGQTINGSYKDKVGIKLVSNTTLERFKQSYRVLTDEEKAAAGRKLEEEANKNQPEQMKTETGKKMMDVGTGIINNLQPEEMSGVGEAATWYPNFSELKVFYNGLSFALVVDISEDKSLNRKKAIELAEMIINERLK